MVLVTGVTPRGLVYLKLEVRLKISAQLRKYRYAQNVLPKYTFKTTTTAATITTIAFSPVS